MTSAAGGITATGTDHRLPRLSLTVGVTGHRPPRLDDPRLAALGGTLQALLARLASTTQQVHDAHHGLFAADAPCLRLVTALAEGADCLSAGVALEAGWRVDACLPFEAAEYEADFPDGPSRGRYHDLLARASSVFALPGRRETANAAYETVGRLVIDQSDLLLAIWDGDQARGRGGTAQVVAEAVARHIPVIHVDVRGLQPPVLLWTGLSELNLEQPTIDTVPCAPADEVLDGVVQALTEPPTNDIDRRMLSRFLRERVAERPPALPFPLLLAMTGVRQLRRSRLRPPSQEECAQRLQACLGPLPETGNHGDILQRKLLPRFGLADAAGAYFAQLFRSGYVANFGLAALAVLLALAGLAAPGIKLPLIALELLAILLILGNTRAGTRAGWHERWLDNRHLAEQLRVVSLHSLLGELELRNRESSEANMGPGWVRWYARATARELGLPHVTVDDTYLDRIRRTAIAMIEDQVAYHAANARQMRHLDHRLHRIGGYLFAATALACAAWIVAKLLGVAQAFMGIDLTITVTMLTAVLPAMGAALYGIRMQGDFSGVADRSQVTATRLDALRRGLADDPLEFSRLQARLRRLSDVMLADVARWRITYQARPLTLPG
ncbi:MAG: hypothetical protein ACR2J7_05350 [Luteimonas sp.]